MKVLRQVAQTLTRQQDGTANVAASFALGVFCGFSPLVGFHAVLALAAAILFRLNKIAVLLGVYLNNPWVFVPYYAFATWVGLRITGMPEEVGLSGYGLSDLLSWEVWSWVLTQWKLLIPAVLGSTVLAIVFALIAYPLSLYTLSRFSPGKGGT